MARLIDEQQQRVDRVHVAQRPAIGIEIAPVIARLAETALAG